jgi:hypothetical protein
MVISLLTTLCFLISSNGFAEEQGITGHPHFFPYTKVLADDYHLRLVVDHGESEMQLIFEDISEKAVRIMPLKTISAEVLFPGGDTKMVEFKAVKNKKKRTSHRDSHPVSRLTKRKAGTFSSNASWLNDSLDFDLIVTFPFQGKDYKFVFDYSTGGHLFPYHMRR